jgi:hypothetical protein
LLGSKAEERYQAVSLDEEVINVEGVGADQAAGVRVGGAGAR